MRLFLEKMDGNAILTAREKEARDYLKRHKVSFIT